MTKPLPPKAKRKRRPRGSLHINDILNAAERVIRRTGRTDFTLTAVQVESRYGVGSFYKVLSGETKAARREDILRRLIQRRAITMQEYVDQQRLEETSDQALQRISAAVARAYDKDRVLFIVLAQTEEDFGGLQVHGPRRCLEYNLRQAFPGGLSARRDAAEACDHLLSIARGSDQTSRAQLEGEILKALKFRRDLIINGRPDCPL